MNDLKQMVEQITYLKYNLLGEGEITGIAYDSRNVKKGELFVAIKGYQTDGHRYIKQALENGAIGVVLSEETYCNQDYPWILVADSRVALAKLANMYYDYPSRQLVLIGVTGTNGKTTTANLIAQIIEDQGHQTGLIGTIHNRIGDEILPVSRTTPESWELQGLFAKMVSKGIKYVVMEVSSHALALHRVVGCDFDVAVFTNLTQDHLDHHGTMMDYAQAKAKLFAMLASGGEQRGLAKTAVINLDDPWAGQFMVASNVPLVTYGIDKEASWRAEDVQVRADGVSYRVDDFLVNLQLTGRFNVYNSLAALAAATSLGFSVEDVINSLEGVRGVLGRFQRVESGGDFTVIVDYAHTPDGLENVISTARAFAKGRVITVFGCGGDRDRTKRRLMGEVAAKLSHYCIVTSDNPRTEDPEAIIGDIMPGVEAYMAPEAYRVEVDRAKAIGLAIEEAQMGDVILIAGKGHEDYQEICGVRHHFNDYEIAQALLKASEEK